MSDIRLAGLPLALEEVESRQRFATADTRQSSPWLSGARVSSSGSSLLDPPSWRRRFGFALKRFFHGLCSSAFILRRWGTRIGATAPALDAPLFFKLLLPRARASAFGLSRECPSFFFDLSAFGCRQLHGPPP